MSSLRNTLREKAVSEAKKLIGDPEKAGKVWDAVMDGARGALPEPKERDGSISALYMLGSQALRAVDKHKGVLMPYGQRGLEALLIFLASGDMQGAQTLYAYLREEAGWDDLYDASRKLQEGTHADKVARDAFYQALWDIGASTARAALPFILSAARVVIPL